MNEQAAFDTYTINGRRKVVANGARSGLDAIVYILGRKGATAFTLTWATPTTTATYAAVGEQSIIGEEPPTGEPATWTFAVTWNDGTTSTATHEPTTDHERALVLTGAEVLRQRGVTVTIHDEQPKQPVQLAAELAGPGKHDLVCSYTGSIAPNAPSCGEPATLHVLVEPLTSTEAATVLACHRHAKLLEDAAAIVDQHPTHGSACALPGVIWQPGPPSTCELDTTDRRDRPTEPHTVDGSGS